MGGAVGASGSGSAAGASHTGFLSHGLDWAAVPVLFVGPAGEVMSGQDGQGGQQDWREWGGGDRREGGHLLTGECG